MPLSSHDDITGNRKSLEWKPPHSSSPSSPDCKGPSETTTCVVTPHTDAVLRKAEREGRRWMDRWIDGTEGQKGTRGSSEHSWWAVGGRMLWFIQRLMWAFPTRCRVPSSPQNGRVMTVMADGSLLQCVCVSQDTFCLCICIYSVCGVCVCVFLAESTSTCSEGQ